MALKGMNSLNIAIDFDTLDVSKLDRDLAEQGEIAFNQLCRMNHITDKHSQDAILLREQIDQTIAKAKLTLADELKGDNFIRQVQSLTEQSPEAERERKRAAAERGRADSALGEAIRQMNNDLSPLGLKLVYGMKVGRKNGKVHVDLTAIPATIAESQNKKTRRDLAFSEDAVTFSMSVDPNILDRAGKNALAKQGYIGFGSEDNTNLYNINQMKAKKMRSSMKNKISAAALAEYHAAKTEAQRAKAMERVRRSTHNAAAMRIPVLTKSDVMEESKSKSHPSKTLQNLVRAGQIGLLDWGESLVDYLLTSKKHTSDIKKTNDYLYSERAIEDLTSQFMLKVLSGNTQNRAKAAEKLAKEWGRKFGLKGPELNSLVQRVRSAGEIFEGTFANANDAVLRTGNFTDLNRHAYDPTGNMNPTERSVMQRGNMARVKVAARGGHASKVKGAGMETATMVAARKQQGVNTPHVYANSIAITSKILREGLKHIGLTDEQIAKMGHLEEGGVYLSPTRMQDQYLDSGEVQITQEEIKKWQEKHRSNKKGTKWDRATAIRALALMKIAGSSNSTALEFEDPGKRSGEDVAVSWENPYSVYQGSKIVAETGLGGGRYTVNSPLNKQQWDALLKFFKDKYNYSFNGDVDMITGAAKDASMNDIDSLIRGQANAAHAFLSGKKGVGSVSSYGKFKLTLFNQLKQAGFSTDQARDLCNIYTYDKDTGQIVMKGDKWIYEKAAEFADPSKTGAFADPTQLAALAQTRFALAVSQYAKESGMVGGELFKLSANGGLDVDLRHYKGRGEMAAIDQPLMDYGSHTGQAGIKETPQTLASLLYTVGIAEMMSGKKFTNVRRAIEEAKKHTPEEEARIAQVEGNLEETLSRYRLGLSEKDVKIDRSILRDLGLNNDFVRKGQKITRKSFEESMIGAIAKAANGEHAYIDIAGRKIPLPKMDDIIWEKDSSGEEVMAMTPEWLSPVTSLLNYLSNAAPASLTAENLSRHEREYQSEYAKNVKFKERAFHDVAVKTYGGHDAYLKLTSVYGDLLSSAKYDEDLRRRLDSSAVMNVKDLEKMLKRGPGDGENWGAYNEVLKGLAEHQIGGIATEEGKAAARKHLDNVIKGFEKGEISEQTYTAKLAKIIARTGNRENEWFNERGITGLSTLRYPENLGFLRNATSTYTLNGASLKTGVMQLGVALQEWEHADFDGDKIREDLTLVAAIVRGLGISIEDFYKELDEYSDEMAKVREPIGKSKRKDYEDQNENLTMLLTPSDLELLRDNKFDATLTALMKEQKGKTGFETVKSANFQALMQQKMHVSSDSTPEEIADWLAATALDELLSATPQYGISAKKILRNLRDREDKTYFKDDGSLDVEKYLGDLRRFYETYDNPDSWVDERKRNMMLERGAQLGIFGGKKGAEDAFDSRSKNMLLGFASNLSGKTDEEKLDIIKNAFGLDLNDADQKRFAEGLMNGNADDISMRYLLGAVNRVQGAITGETVFGPNGDVIKLNEGLKTLFGAGTSLTAGSQASVDQYVRSQTGGNDSMLAGASTSMERAAQNLNNAAEALLKLAGGGGIGGGGGGGGGGRGFKTLPTWNKSQQESLIKNMETELNMRATGERDAEEANQKIAELLAKGEEIPADLLSAARGRSAHNYTSVSRYLSFLSPTRNKDETGFLRAVKEGSIENNFGYKDKKTLDILREDYFTHAQGTIGGALVELYHLAKEAGIDVSDMEDPKKMIEAGQGQSIVENVFSQIEKAGTSSTASEGAKKLYEDIFGDDEYGIYALYRDGMEMVGKMFSDNPEEVKKRFGTIFGLTSGQNLQTSIMAGKKAKFLGAEAEVRGMFAGDYYGGRGDLLFSTVDENGKKIISMIDTKNPNTNLSSHNIAQQLMYLHALKQERYYVQQHGLEKDSEGNVTNRLDFDEFEKENFTFVHALGMTKERYEAMRDSDDINVYISGLARSGKSIALKVEASEKQLDSIMSGFKEVQDGIAGGKDVSEAVNALAKQLTDPELFSENIFEGMGLDEVKKKIIAWAKSDSIIGPSDDELLAVGKTPSSMKGYESLTKQRARLLAKIYGDKRAAAGTFDQREKAALESEAELLGEQNSELEDQIELEKQRIMSMGVTEEQIGIIDERTEKFLHREIARVNVMKKGRFNLWDSLSSSLQGVINRFTQMGLAYNLLNKLKKSFSEIVQAATQLDKAMVNLRVVTGASYEDAKEMIHGYAQLGSQLAATTLEVSTAAQEWLRQGYDVAEVNKLVESSIKLSVLGMMSASDATKSLTSAMKGFKMEAGDVSEIVDKFTSLDMKAATTAGDIATALSKFATTAQMAGVDIDQAAAMATTIMDVSQNDAGATGNALKTIFSRFGNVKAGTFQKMSLGDSDETTDKINDIERVLNTLGIQVRSSAREMRDFDDVLADIAEKWQFLDSVSQNAIATALAGTRQRESFAVLMNNYDKYREFLEVSRDSEGTSDKKYQSYLEQLEASQKRLKAAWEDIANSSQISGFMTNMNNFLAGAVKALPTIIRYVTKLFVTLNSYKIPKLFGNFFSVKDGWGNKGKSILRGLTSGGLQEKANAYNEKEFTFSFDLVSSSAKKLAAAFDEARKSTKAVSQTEQERQRENQKTSKTENERQKENQETSKTENERQKENQETSQTENERQQTNKSGKLNRFGASKQGLGMAATGAAASLVTGLTMGNQGLNWQTGQMQDASKMANAAATVNSTVSNIAYIWGPIAGLLANMLAEALNKFVLIPWIDDENNKLKARVEYANKLYDQISGISDSVSSLQNYAKLSYLTAEDSAELNETIANLLSKYYEIDAEARGDIEKYLKPILEEMGIQTNTFYDALAAYKNGDQQTRKLIANAVEYAQQRAASEEKAEANEAKSKEHRKDIQKVFDNVFEVEKSGMINGIWYDLVETLVGHRILSKEKYDKMFENGGGPEYHGEAVEEFKSHSRNMMYNVPARELEPYLKQLLDNMDQSDEERYKAYKKIYDEIKNLSDVEWQQLDAYNRNAAYNALLITKSSSGSLLLGKTADELKSMGTEKVTRLIAQTLAETGEFSGESLFIGDNPENGLTDYAERIIREAMANDPDLAALSSGITYKLSDLKKGNALYDWDSRTKEYQTRIESFASALHMTPEEFLDKLNNGDLSDRLGEMTLGDLLKTPEELRQSMEDLSSLFKTLSSDISMSAETLETIINKFPTLIQYLGDSNSMMEAMIKNLGEYAEIYTMKIYDSLISSADYATSVKKRLYESNEYDKDVLMKIFGDASTVKDMIDILREGPTALAKKGLDVASYEKLVKEIQGLFDNIDIGKIFMRQIATDTMIPYITKILDKQIERLNKQKEALQQINKQREYENKLLEARNKLEEAGKEKKRVWREGVGWVYESDQAAIAEAQKNLEEVESERQIRELDILIEEIEAQKELISKMQSDAELEALKESVDALLGKDSDGVGINGLIKATEKLYKGDESVLSLLSNDVANSLTDIKDLVSRLVDSDLELNYGSGTTTKELFDKALDNSNKEQGQAATEALNKRGYTQKDSGVFWDYKIPEGNVSESDINEAIYAYSRGDIIANRDEIKDFLEGKGYEYDENTGKWNKKRQGITIAGMGNFFINSYGLDTESDHYKYLRQDFESGQAIWYQKTGETEDGTPIFENKGKINASAYGNSLTAWRQDHVGDIILGAYGDQELAYATVSGFKTLTQAASGALSLPGGPTLLNEIGTEAIVTPYGTVTSLPSGTGVVPADITKNLWALGEVAPAISRLLEPMVKKDGAAVLGDNFSVQNMVVNMNPDGSFDVDGFITELKSAIALRRNS